MALLWNKSRIYDNESLIQIMFVVIWNPDFFTFSMFDGVYRTA